MKKLVSLLLILAIAAGLLAACAGVPVSVTDPLPEEDAQTAPETSDTTETTDTTDTPETDVPAEGAVKTGLSVSTSLSSSKSATEDADGVVQADAMLVAVTVDDGGVIRSCAIDAVQAKVPFDLSGQLTGDVTAPIASKNELGDDYGMKKASSIGKEWYEQAAAFADYCVGKTLDEISGIAVTEEGKAGDADLAASVTISIGGFLSGVEDAVANATHLGASAGDTLKLITETTAADSVSAGDEDGKGAIVSNIAAVTLDGSGVITSCVLDAVQPSLTFDGSGQLTGDATAPVLSKDQLGDDYGMKKASSIGKEWYEQAAAFAGYCVGKTVDEVTGLAVTEEGKAGDAALAASVTISIGGFQSLIAMAG